MESLPYLVPGDKVGIVSTARKVDRKLLSSFLSWLKKNNFDVVFAPNLFNSHHQFAGTDRDRIADLQYMLDHTEIKAVFCAKGGYGTCRIIDQVTWAGFQKHPKWIIGFSDPTILLAAAIHQGYPSIHGPMPLTFDKTNVHNLNDLFSILTGKINNLSFSSQKENISGKAKGKLIGGNLSILHSMIGTEYDFNYRDSILFIEDLDEYLYHTDRMLVHFDRIGLFDKINGLIVGSFSDMNDNNTPFGENIYDMLVRIFESKGIPLAFGCPSGHTEDNHPLVLGKEIELSVSRNMTEIIYL